MPRVGERKLRVLLVPDSIHWVTGTIARSILTHNDWIDGTIVSGPVLDIIARSNPRLFAAFDLVHFLCPYASKRWLPILRNSTACVTSHHHVTAWEAQRHNLDGDAIIVGSNQWADDVIERGAQPERVFCVPYGVDASRFVPATTESRASVRSELKIPLGDIVVGFFAKQSSNELDRKGTDVFADAIQRLSRELDHLTALIIGPGWREFVSALERNGVKCVWLPFVRDSVEMARMYRALDFYWVTARVEGGPVTLLEAMSCGVCCITTPVGLAREIVVDEVNGGVVPFDDAQSVVRKTLTLSHDPETRSLIGRGARQTILATMDVRITSSRMRDVYTSALAHFEDRRRSTGVRQGHLAQGAEATLPRDIVGRVALLEQLEWAESLIMQHQRAVAFRIIGKAWLQHPLSSLPLRYLLRNLLPTSVTEALVRLKAAVVGRTIRA